MIFVRRTGTIIPDVVLKVAERAQRELEALPEGQRRTYILRKSHIWTGFIKYLKRMSFGKCWYSESKEVQSFFDVDHFRPKLEAIRSEIEKDAGYAWLAFTWDNFRLSAQRCNRLSTNEDTEIAEGKGSWFPLLDGSPRATWGHRCTDDERPVLLDPTRKSDVRLVDFNQDGYLIPSILASGRDRRRVETSIRLLGLNLPGLVEARADAMRQVDDEIRNYLDLVGASNQVDNLPDLMSMDEKLDKLAARTQAKQQYCAAVRARFRQKGLGMLCVADEELDS